MLREQNIYKMDKNVFEMIENEWFLVGAINKEKKANAMTAQWGALGFLWKKPIAIIFVRPQRYTHEFIEDSNRFTLSFFDDKYKDMLMYFGRVSGRDEDKIKKENLHIIDNSDLIFDEAKLTFVCKKLYKGNIEKDSFIEEIIPNEIYKNNDYHTFYIGEIEKLYKNEN